MQRNLCLLALVILLLCTVSAGAATIRVPADQPTIQAGINAALNGDTVLVEPGTYTGSGNRDIDFLGKTITLKSTSGAQATIIDCQGSPADPHRGFVFAAGEDTTTVLDGFTVTNGYEVEGGAMLVMTSPLIMNCVISGDSAVRGGGMAIGGTPVIVGCTISDNAASHVGGAFYNTGVPPRMRNCIITSNRVWSPDDDWYKGRGGAFYGAAYLDHCVIANNWAEHLGGGLNVRDAGVFTIVNCTFFGNTAMVDGSCAHFDASTFPNFVNTIVAAHRGSRVLFCWGVANPTFRNCDVWGNAGGDALCGTNLGGNISQDPQFCDTSAHDYFLAGGSPCVGAGEGGVDIGAFGIGCTGVDVSGESGGEIWPQDFQLAQNVPNPFNSATVIAYEVRHASRVKLTIYNSAGRCVRRLVDADRPAGSYREEWDGRDEKGRTVASGVYFYQLSEHGRATSKKMVLLK